MLAGVCMSLADPQPRVRPYKAGPASTAVIASGGERRQTLRRRTCGQCVVGALTAMSAPTILTW